jgi:uncharacterized membrane protein YphA (DoxX/SURF4 family)
MNATLTVSRRRSANWPAALRIAFGLVWAIDASLKWLPGFRSSFAAMLDAAGQGQPSWLRPWFQLWTGMSHTEATLLAYGTAATETAIAIAVLAGFARKTAYLGGAAYSVVVWAAAEGFGGPYQAGATDIGTAIIYPFVFLGLLILAAQNGPDEYCVDRYLERRLPWWDRIAEVRPASRNVQVVPTLSAPDSDPQHSEHRAAMVNHHR